MRQCNSSRRRGSRSGHGQNSFSWSESLASSDARGASLAKVLDRVTQSKGAHCSEGLLGPAGPVSDMRITPDSFNKKKWCFPDLPGSSGSGKTSYLSIFHPRLSCSAYR
jgi:hypothetical protein